MNFLDATVIAVVVTAGIYYQKPGDWFDTNGMPLPNEERNGIVPWYMVGPVIGVAAAFIF